MGSDDQSVEDNVVRTVITPNIHMTSSSQATAIGTRGERNEEAAAASEGGNGGRQLVMPEDGYKWRKYGQKFIKNIQKNRSYFRCRHKLCGAKKKVDWHPRNPSSDIRIVYEGAHQHGDDRPPSSVQGAETRGGSGGGSSNHYELGAQYFGARAPSHD